MADKISVVKALEVIDSRGRPTVMAIVETESGAVGKALVPSGASTGKYEACELRDGDTTRYGGMGVTKAVHNVNNDIYEAIKGMDVCDQVGIDNAMIELDGTENKSKLGANAILAVSLACAKAHSVSRGVELFEIFGDSNKLPVPLVNVINGGAHARNSIDVQEFMLVPHNFESFSEALRAVCEVFYQLKTLLSQKGYYTGLGDEGGFMPDLQSIEQCLSILAECIEKAGYKCGSDISLALDIAASELFDSSTATYSFKRMGISELTSDDLIDLYCKLLDNYPIVSIEDGLSEDDWEGWKNLTSKLSGKIQLVGDDLFVTNPVLLQKGINNNVANAILIKLNQIGTVTETLKTIEIARRNDYACIISHRSGETEDTTIADFAVATGCGQIKTGSVNRGERTAKYNRLLEIEHKLGQSASFAGIADIKR